LLQTRMCARRIPRRQNKPFSVEYPIMAFLRRLLVSCSVILTVSAVALGQPVAAPQVPAAQNQAQLPVTVRPDYVLGPDDQIIIRAPQVAEINERPFRVDANGFVELPIVGKLRAGGLTVQAFEAELVNRLREFVREPQIFITLAQYRNEPVFVIGSFRTPGIYPLQGRRTLVEMLSTVGGTLPTASRRIKITRRSEYSPIPLPNATVDPEKKTSTVEINLDSLTQNVNPEEDIVLQPYDIISAERAERIYVTGEVTRSLGIEMGERNSLSVTQAVTEAGGFTLNAKMDKVRVLRQISGTDRRAEIIVDAQQVLAGRAPDFPLQPNDVLYVPRDSTRAVLTQVATTGLASLPYILVTLLVNNNRTTK
jgi:polysaccharide biosynthesis/export protein